MVQNDTNHFYISLTPHVQNIDFELSRTGPYPHLPFTLVSLVLAKYSMAHQGTVFPSNLNNLFPERDLHVC